MSSSDSQSARQDYTSTYHDEYGISNDSDTSKKQVEETEKEIITSTEITTDLNDVIAKQITNPNIIMKDIL